MLTTHLIFRFYRYCHFYQAQQTFSRWTNSQDNENKTVAAFPSIFALSTSEELYQQSLDKSLHFFGELLGRTENFSYLLPSKVSTLKKVQIKFLFRN